MATLSHSESRRRYSWWWNSHISPKNSKWLQENLADMDAKVKAMIKLLEEDADSFARRAEMYYKKRPELMKLVEEFYRAYRALAEKYDSATGALRQAHRTMTEAFPNQIPLMLPDESAYGSITDDAELNSPGTPPPGHPGYAFDADGLKDRSSLPSDFQVFDRKGTYSKEAGSIARNNMGLKQSNEIFTIAEGRARKGLDFIEEEGESYPNNAIKGSRGFQMVKEKQNKSNAINGLQQDVFRLSTENQNMKSKIMEASERVSEAENEVHTLKDTLAKLNSQKDSEQHNHQLSLEKISSLESQLSNTQNSIRRLNDELVNEARKLFSAEELIQSLRLELDLLENKAKMKDQELKAKHDELDELNVILQDKNHQCIQAEISLLSKEKLLIESQQELKLLNLEIKNETEKLRNVELRKEKLEGEMNKLLGENNSLKEENLQHDLTIKSLQDQINSLKDERSKLEEEIEIHVREKESLKQELNLLQRDRSDLERKVKNLLDELEIATVASDTLQASIEKLESEKIELKENCNKMEAQNESLMEKLKDMDKISEENRILENSLSHGNAEIEVLREKIAKLIASHESLNLEISTLVAEKDSLVSQLETITQNVENLSAKNAFLENELSNVNNEVESLKAKLKDFEASCQFLNNQNSILRTEKLTLISQVESITLNLEHRANEFAELQDKHSSLLRENDLSVSQISELQNLLKLAKQEHKSLIESHKVKFADLGNKISFLQKENLLKEKDLEAEQNNFACSMMENFVLQASLSEVHEKNACLSLEGRKHLEGQERAETLVKQLEKEKLTQLENISSLSRDNEKLNEKIHLLSTKLLVNGQLKSLDQIPYEVLLDFAIAEVTKLLDSISDVECENQKMHLQISVLVTFLRQIALDAINLTTEKFSLEKELDIKVKEMLFLEKKQLELKHGEEILQLEMEILSTHLSNLKEAVQASNNENVKIMEEKRSLSQELYNLKQKHNELKEENIEVFLETMKLDYLCCFFKCLSAERLTELKCFSKDLASLHSVKSCLETEINRLNGELTVVKSENTQIMKLIAHQMEEHTKSLLHLEFDLNTTRSFFEELDLEIQNIKVQLLEKEAQLSEANNKVEFTQGEKAEIQKLLQAFQLEHKEAMQAREELEKTISILSDVVAEKNNEARSLHESGEMLQKEIDRLKTRENIFISELEKQTNEFDISAGKIDALLTEFQILKANAATSEEKVQDIIVEGEIHSMVEKQILTMELTLINNYVDILKTELDDLVAENKALINDMETHPPKITSLWKAIACLEEEVMSITNFKPLENQNRMEDIPSVSNRHCGNQLNEDNFGTALELENLMTKIETLQKATSKAKTVLKEERLDSSSRLEAAHKEIEELKMKALLQQPEIHRSSDSIRKFADDRVIGDDKISKERYGQVIKDIPLDEASSPLPRMNIKQGGQYVEFDDQLWEDAERDGNNKTWKVSTTAVEHDMEIVEEEKSEFASSELAEKELNIDKLDMFDRTFTSQKDWDERVLEELTSDAVRLSGIMLNVEALKRKMESLQVQELPPSFGSDTIKAQLKETEATVLQLIHFSNNLIRKAQERSSSNYEDIKGRRIISEQTRRVSKKVVKLEFELQKIQYVWLKLEEEYENRRVKAAQRRSRVMLRDYLYGRKDHHRKKSRFCGCMRPKTTDDN